jgi:hypothetical protein
MLVVIGAVLRRRAIVLLTESGVEVPCMFKGRAREQLLDLLAKE